jgi:hypothetical protein
MSGDLHRQLVLLELPLLRHLDIERIVDAAIELVHIHGVHAPLRALVLNLQAHHSVY